MRGWVAESCCGDASGSEVVGVLGTAVVEGRLAESL